MMAAARPPVEPVLHPAEVIEAALERGDVHCDEVRQSLAWLGLHEYWADFYVISEIAGMEVSLLIDADDRCYVDWGTQSRVGLNPPAGSRIPFKVWTHTHPSGNPYWSFTDQNTLAIASSARLIERALVLGNCELKQAVWSAEPADDPISSEGPLSQWTNEDLTEYPEQESPWGVEVSS